MFGAVRAGFWDGGAIGRAAAGPFDVHGFQRWFHGLRGAVVAGIDVVLRCEAEGCGRQLELGWPKREYVSLIQPSDYGEGADPDLGHLTLDGAAPVPPLESGWRVGKVRFEYAVRCPDHAAELDS